MFKTLVTIVLTIVGTLVGVYVSGEYVCRKGYFTPDV